MARIVIDLDQGPFRAALAQVRARTANLQPLLLQLGLEVLSVVQEKFRAQGPGWAPLAPATIAKRRGRGKDIKILQDTGRLHGSIVPGGRDSIFRVTPTAVEVGTNVPYGRVHQYGAIVRKRIGSGKHPSRRKGGATFQIPARPFLPSLEELQPDFERVIQDFLEDIGAD